MVIQTDRFPVEGLSIDRIRTDGGTQPRVAVSDEVVAKHADLYRQGATPWFQSLRSAASAVCFVTGYIRLQNVGRNLGKTHVNPHGYAAVHLGPNPERFRSEFETAGCVCSRTFTQPQGSESRATDMEVTR